MATYREIQKWVKDKHNFTPKTCWIAHVKEICGLNPKKAYNREDADVRKHPCPDDKQPIIKEAFRHFRMIKCTSSNRSFRSRKQPNR